jgi:hypothetical protein
MIFESISSIIDLKSFVGGGDNNIAIEEWIFVIKSDY